MQFAFEAARERVHPVRTIECDRRDLFLDAVDQVFVAHGVLYAGLVPSTAISTATTPSPAGLTMMGLRSSARNCAAWATAKSPSRTRKFANASMSPGGRPRAP